MIGLDHDANSDAAGVIQNIAVDRYKNITNYLEGCANNITGSPIWGRVVFEVESTPRYFFGQLAWFNLFALLFMIVWITHIGIVPVAIVGIFFGLHLFAVGMLHYLYVGIVFMVVAVASMG
jgi:hypothetical protein